MSGFEKTATRERLGTVSLSNCRRFPLSCGAISVIPVMFPPGRARLAIRPVATGSALRLPMTIGIVSVTCLAAKLAGEPDATMRSTFRATSSAASSGSRSLRSAENRYSMTMFRPST